MDAKYDFVIGKIKNSLAATLPKGAEAYLYGSRARGDANDNSDWDILLLFPESRVGDKEYMQVAYPLTALGWDINETINPQLYTMEEWKNISFSPFHKNVTNDRIRL